MVIDRTSADQEGAKCSDAPAPASQLSSSCQLRGRCAFSEARTLSAMAHDNKQVSGCHQVSLMFTRFMEEAMLGQFDKKVAHVSRVRSVACSSPVESKHC